MTNKFELTINGNTIFLSPTGVDDVPVHSVSDMIQEEKLSFQLWGEFYSGNLENTPNDQENFLIVIFRFQINVLSGISQL